MTIAQRWRTRTIRQAAETSDFLGDVFVGATSLVISGIERKHAHCITLSEHPQFLPALLQLLTRDAANLMLELAARGATFASLSGAQLDELSKNLSVSIVERCVVALGIADPKA